MEEQGVGRWALWGRLGFGVGGTGRWSISYLPPPGGGRPSRAELRREPGGCPKAVRNPDSNRRFGGDQRRFRRSSGSEQIVLRTKLQHWILQK